MLFYVLDFTHPFIRTLAKESREEVFDIFAPVFVHRWFGKLDFIVELVSVFGIEGWNSIQHFENDGAKTPPVDWLSMAFLFDDFWGQIFWSSAYRVLFFIAYDVI